MDSFQRLRPGPLQVLLAAPLPPPDHGGIANWTRIIRQEFASRPDVELAFLDSSVRWRSATNVSLSWRLAGGSWQALRDVCRAARRFRQQRFDVFHLCSSGALAAAKDVLLLRLAKACGVARVVHYRMGRLPAVAARGGTEWRLLRSAMQLADRVLVLDRQSARCLEQTMPQTHVVRLPNLVEVDAIDKVCGQLEPPPARERAARIVYLGQLLPAKGLRELVTACARLAAGGLRLDLVGPVESRFRQELSRLAGPGAGWLQFHGPVAHDRSLAHLAAADVFVLPSYSEGFPNAVLEAMVCQRPILATSVGAIPEMLDCGGREECGVCVPPRDVAALTRELQRLLADEAARRQLGMRARRRAERLYAAPVVSGELLRLWQQVGRPAEPDVARAA